MPADSDDATPAPDAELQARHLRNDLKNEAAEHGDGLAQALQDIDPDREPADGEDATD